MILLLKISALFLITAGCNSRPTASLIHADSEKIDEESVSVAVESGDGKDSAQVDASLNVNQVIKFNDVMISVAPGSLSIDTKISAEAAVDRSSETVDLGVDAKSAGVPVLITSLNGAELIAPLTIALDIGTALHLSGGLELAVFYHMRQNGVYSRGLIYGKDLRVEGSKAIFSTMGFGFFQLVYVKNIENLKSVPTTEKSPNELELEKKAEVATKVEEKVSEPEPAKKLTQVLTHSPIPSPSVAPSPSPSSVPSPSPEPAPAPAPVETPTNSGSLDPPSSPVYVENNPPSVFSYSCQQPIVSRGGAFGLVSCSVTSPASDPDQSALFVGLTANTTCHGPIVTGEFGPSGFSFTGTGSITQDCQISWNLFDGRGGRAFSNDQVIRVREKDVSSVGFGSISMVNSDGACKVSVTADITKRQDFGTENLFFSSSRGSLSTSAQEDGLFRLDSLIPFTSLAPGAFTVALSTFQESQSQFTHAESFVISRVQVVDLPEASSGQSIPNGAQVRYKDNFLGCKQCSGVKTQLSVGNRFAAYIGSDGVYTWGDSMGTGRTGKTIGVNSRYPLGVNSRYPRSMLSGTNGNEKNIDLGNSATCIVDQNRLPKCMGNNAFGALASPSMVALAEPRINSFTSDSFSVVTSDSSLPVVRQVVTYDDNTLALLSNGYVAASGASSRRLLGDSDLILPEYEGVLVKTSSTELLQNVSQLSMGALLAMAIVVDEEGSKVYTWGFNTLGQLGLGDSVPRKYASRVTLPIGGVPVHVAAGDNHGCVLSSVGTAYCFGRNQFGQLGSGALSDSNVPTLVKKVGGDVLTGILAISTSRDSTYFIVKNEESTILYSVGKNSNGQLGVGDLLDRSFATPAVNSSGQIISGVLAVDGGGSNVCILGQNAANQLKISCVGEDTGVVISSTGAFPGANTASFSDNWSFEIDRGERCSGYTIND